MKKILIVLTLVCGCIFLAGCGKENVKLNFTELAEKIDNLENEEFARVTAATLLGEKMEGLEGIYQGNFNKEFGINDDNIEEANIAINHSTNDMFLIVKAIEGKKDDVKKEIDAYMDSLDEEVKAKETFEEYDGYLIYIVNEDSKNLMKEVKDCHNKLFTALMDVDDDTLSQKFGIEKEMVDEYLAKIPMMVVNSNSYIILKPASGQKDAVKEKMNTYMENLENQWKTYLPDQYDLVKNRLEKEYGDYLIYIISQDNDAVYNAIKNE